MWTKHLLRAVARRSSLRAPVSQVMFIGTTTAAIGISTRRFSVLSGATVLMEQQQKSSTTPSSFKWPHDKVTLYQYEPCPYCCKVKAVLDYYNVPYEVVEVNPVTKKETSFTDYNKVPIAKIRNEIINDSSRIISEIQQEMNNQSSTDVNEKKWCTWVDQNFITLMPPNIYRTIPESLQSFDYCLTEGNFTPFERRMSKYVGAAAMYLISKKLKKKYGIEDPRESLNAAVTEWLTIGCNRTSDNSSTFCGGTSPNLADLSVFGVLRSIDGLDTFTDVMTSNPNLLQWYDEMKQIVGTSSRII